MVDKDIERFSQLGVIAQGSLLWAEYDTAGEAFVSKDQFERYYRYQSLVKAGVKLTFGNDYPSSGSGVKGISPLLNIEVGLTRQTPGVADAPIQNMIDERLTLTQLIKGYTLDGAYQLRRDHETGSIMVGKYADLVLIQDNLFNIKPHKIHSVPVLTTWWKGRVVFNNTSQ
jgi:predicted amidohydrolase YtcJ